MGIWSCKLVQHSSWTWLKILKVRDKARPYIEDTQELSWDGKQMPMYYVSTVWNCIRRRGDIVDWFDLIWGKPGIRRHNMICWLAIQRKLITKEV
ncbi:hypothetical protein LINPERHAP1_LOCUS22508 [Linum perenne]